MLRAGAHSGISALWTRAIRFCSDRRGVAAVEFAFIVPVLLVMYFVTMEASQALETSKKVSRISSMVADLITQQPTIVKANIQDIMKIGTSTLRPYNRSVPDITVTAINVTSGTPPEAQVVWSWKVTDGTTYGPDPDAAKNSFTTVPTTLNVAGTYLIRVETKLAYQPILTWSADGAQRLGLTTAFNQITMDETYYLRPRRSPSLPCADC